MQPFGKCLLFRLISALKQRLGERQFALWTKGARRKFVVAKAGLKVVRDLLATFFQHASGHIELGLTANSIEDGASGCWV